MGAPDLFRLIADYLETGNADDLIVGSYMGVDRPVGLRQWLRWTLAGPRHHLWMYDGESLRDREAESVYVEAVRPR